MVKLDIYGGLLGTGKTTLIRQMLATAYAGHKTAVIENEIGKVNLDAELLKKASISVREISSGCICCTVKGSFTEAVELLVKQENPDYIVVEPSGVADLADVAKACADSELVKLNRVIMVVNAKKQRRLLKVVGEFYLNQLQNAQTVYLNFTEKMSREEIEETKSSLWEINPELVMVDTPLEDIAADTFPEGRASSKAYRDRSTAELSVLEDKSFGAVRMRSRGKQPLSTWCCTFEQAFDEADIRRLLEIFRREEADGVWRVKGYLKMTNGRIRKVDVVFGDQFQEELEGFDDDKVNQLVIIGKKLNLPWLREQMGTFFKSDI